MNNFEQKRNQKIFEVLVMIKVIYILLGIVAMISSNSMNATGNLVLSAIYASLVLFLIVTYFSWIANYPKYNMERVPKTRDILETILLLVIFIIIIGNTELHESPYKFMSVFIILIGAIQFGRNYSIVVAISSGAIILAVDFLASSNKQALSFYFERDLVLIGALLVTAFILGLYVDIEKEHGKELKTLVNIDELTGLYNHRYFQEYLTKSIEYSNENNNKISLLFMDIDYFKNYNDTNGHQAGDLLLREVGNILKSCIRENDIVARYGGEEFAAILPNTEEESAIVVGERIRKAIENTYFYGQENQPNKNITISIGVSSYPDKSKTKHQLINTADDALYRAKSFNKNRVEAYYNVL